MLKGQACSFCRKLTHQFICVVPTHALCKDREHVLILVMLTNEPGTSSGGKFDLVLG